MMSFGAMTVVNAIPCGRGAAVGLKLRTNADLAVKGNERVVRIINDPCEDTRMAELCVKNTFKHFGIAEPDGWTLSVNSEIPVSRGLKSSSSACNAIVSSVSEWIRKEFGIGFGNEKDDAIEMIRLGVRCAREAGVTVTGAFDDACACHLGGFVVTDNGKDELLQHRSTERYDVILLVPERKIRKPSLDKERLYALSGRMKDILGKADDDWLSALTMNGRLIADALGIDDSISSKALDAGALAAGVSGTGPAVSVVVNNGKGVSFIKDLEHNGYQAIITGTR